MNRSKYIRSIAIALLTLTLATEINGQVNSGPTGSPQSNLTPSGQANDPSNAPKTSNNIFKQIDERQNLNSNVKQSPGAADKDMFVPTQGGTGSNPLPQDDLSRSFTPTSPIETVIQNQLADLKDLDISKAYYAYMSMDFRKIYSLEVFRAFVRKNATLFRNKSFAADNTVFKGVIAQVSGRLVSTDGQVAQALYDLVQEDGVWKIRNIDLVIINQAPPAPVKKLSRL